MIVPRCSRCGRPCDTYLCPKCIKAKQAYVDEVNELLAHGVPLSSGETHNRDLDLLDIEIAIEHGAYLC